ncbi:MAG: aminopeptidase P family protein [Cellulosilyticaceae bacterium]
MNRQSVIEQLRKQMKEMDLWAYIIPSADYHQSEYVAEYFKGRAYLSGFTGSAGTVVITREEAGLWTDGRYFIQAAKQLEGSGIKLYRMGEKGVPTLLEFLKNQGECDARVGVDARLISADQGKEWSGALEKKQMTLVDAGDLLKELWADRPAMPKGQAFELPLQYSGMAVEEKLESVRREMTEAGADYHLLTTLDDQAWLLNIRGRDITYWPVVQCYTLMSSTEVKFFVDEEKIDTSIHTFFEANHITIYSYEGIDEVLMQLPEDAKVLVDPAKVNHKLVQSIEARATAIMMQNPTVLMKARKNPIELENIRKGHIKDGVAFTKWMYWLKKEIGNTMITEMSATERLESLRAAQEGYIEPSFKTIAAFKEHAAMMHYSASIETDYTLEEGHFFLVDSGGQYFEGTTDITRTMALGVVDPMLKQHFTAVLRGMIGLSKAKFLQGVRGINLDILARGPIWDLGIDYKCGTGHGVGYLLNVHEAPNGFRWRIVPERNDSCELEVGMLTTNEPGIYIEGSHGIRIENELVVKPSEETDFGTFLEFETVTVAPIDKDAIAPEYMNKAEKDWLNAYHQYVYETLAPHLDADECVWLYEYTRPII